MALPQRTFYSLALLPCSSRMFPPRPTLLSYISPLLGVNTRNDHVLQVQVLNPKQLTPGALASHRTCLRLSWQCLAGTLVWLPTAPGRRATFLD